MTVEFEVRRVRAGEWTALREVRLAALASDPLAFGSTLEREAGFADTVWRERATRGAGSTATGQWVGVAPPGRIVGTATLAETDGDWHLFGMWVDPRARGRGLGGRLLDTAIEWGRRTRPDRSIVLEVNRRQTSAVRLYRSRTFRFTGRSRPIEHTPGEAVVEMVWAGPAPDADGPPPSSESGSPRSPRTSGPFPAADRRAGASGP